MSPADDLQRIAWELRAPFLEWCAELGRRNDSAEWWASPLGSRNPHERFFERICKLAAGSPAPADQPTPVRQAGVPRRLLARVRRPDHHPRHRRHVLARRGLLEPRPFTGDALLCTWVDERSFAPDGSYRDPHLGPLASLLRERGLEVAYLARVLPTFSFAEAVERLRCSGETFLHPDAYLALDRHRATAERATRFAPELTEGPVAGAAALARRQLDEGRSTLAASLLYESLVAGLAAAGVRPRRIVYTCEGHAWELVLARAVREHLPETELVAYENLNMPRLALSMFAAPGEPRPLPHRIVANGPAYADVLRDEGWPAASVRVGCGLRHTGLWDLPRREDALRQPPRILAATEIAPDRTHELVTKATAAFGDRVVVKAHPLVPRHRLPHARYDDRPFLELLAEADVLLHTWSGVAYEALALGVPPVFVRADTSLDLDPLEFAADVHWTARSPDELRAAVDAIARTDLATWRGRARETAQDAIAPPSAGCVEAFL